MDPTKHYILYMVNNKNFAIHNFISTGTVPLIPNFLVQINFLRISYENVDKFSVAKIDSRYIKSNN
jgi:hypothetical protein